MKQFPRLTRCFLTPILLCATLSNCAWLIPPEKSSARYNSVVGEAHRPELNPASGVMPATELPQQEEALDYPPVAAPMPARVPEIVTNDVPPPAGAAPVVAPVAAAMPTVAVPAPSVAAPIDTGKTAMRQVPVENAAVTGAVIAQSAYPNLTAVPPAPSGADADAAARLARVRAQLEQERGAAEGDKATLLKDASAEPSLSPDKAKVDAMPLPAAPLPEATGAIAPMSPASVTVPPQRVAPAANPVIAPMPVAPPSGGRSSMLPPPLPPLAANPAPSVRPVAAMPEPAVSVPVAQQVPVFPMPVQPAQAVAQEPIVLRAPQALAMPPQSAPYAAPSSAMQTAAAQPLLPPAAGGFNPLEGAGQTKARHAGGYPSDGNYLPASRYLQRAY